MAEENEEQQEPSGLGKKKLVLFGAIGLGVILIITVVIWLFMGTSNTAESSSDSTAAVNSEVSNVPPPQVGNALYVGMPHFVFIVPGDTRTNGENKSN